MIQFEQTLYVLHIPQNWFVTFHLKTRSDIRLASHFPALKPVVEILKQFKIPASCTKTGSANSL